MSVRHPRTACHRVVNSPAIRLLAAPVVALVIACMPAPATAYGGLGNYQLSPDEVALLPAFCRHTQLIIERHGSPVEQRQWVERVGPGFLAMHHYCIAVVAFVRSHRHTNSALDRTGYLSFAEQNQTYVVQHVKPDFALLPEVLYRRGQVRVRQGRTDDAIADLEEALRADPRHARASHELASVLLAAGNRSRAEAVLKTGLENAPESKLLKSMLAELQTPPRKK